MRRHAGNRKANQILFAGAILACVVTIGTALGLMFRKTAPVENQFMPAEVSCAVAEEFDAATGAKSSIAVQNTGNIPAYLRVRLVSYWVDAAGNRVGKPSEMPAFTLAEGDEFTCQPGDFIFVPDVKAKVLAGEDTFPALALSGGQVKALTLYLKNTTPEERELLLTGCLMNHYAAQNKA